MSNRRESHRGFWRLARFLAMPKAEQDAILRVAMERAAAEAERDAQNRRDDWSDYDGAANWIDKG